MCPQRRHLCPCVLLSVLLSLWMDLTSGEMKIQLIPQYPVIGGSVTLNVTGVTGNILSFTWYKGPSKDPKYLILTYIPNDPSPLIPGPLYFSRATPFLNGSLVISDLSVTDSGHYIVNIQTDKPGDVSVALTVYERVSKPKVTVSTSLPKENDPFTLTCDTSNAERILWSRDSAGLPPGHVLSTDNRTITFSRVKRTDSGDYRCEAVNKVSEDISDPYTVTVNYGPENIQITGQFQVYAGSFISLTCSADSVPLPEYRWRVNDTDIGRKHHTLRIDHARPDHNGTYTCVVKNSVTQDTVSASAFVYMNASMDSSGPVVGIVTAVTLVVVALVIIGGIILYRRFVHPARNKRNETSADGPDQPPVYENVLDKVQCQPAKEESSYMSLQCRSEDTYGQLVK